MQLVVATYERFLLGYGLPDELQEGCMLKRSFTYAAHQGPVRCVAAGGPWVISGGQDDQLHIYDVQHNKDLGFVMNPGDGAIPCLQLFTPKGKAVPSHLFSGSDDGSIAIWAAGGGWQHLKLMRGHKGPVRGLSVHPTGKLALSVGHDKALRMWNLSKGRCSYTAKLEAAADTIEFSPSGDSYALICDKLISLHSVAEEGSVLARLQHSRRACCMLQAEDGHLILSGQDDGDLLLWDTRCSSQQPSAQLTRAHQGRIRAVTAVSPGAGGGLPQHIASASSDGVVKLWDVRHLGSSSSGGGGSSSGGGAAAAACRAHELAYVDTKGRVTGMVLSAPERKVAATAAMLKAAVSEQKNTGEAAATAAGSKGQNIAGSKKKKRNNMQRQLQQQQQQQQIMVTDLDEQQQPEDQPQQKLLKKKSTKQQQQQPAAKQAQAVPAGAADDVDAALVPRLKPAIVKKRNKDKRQLQAAAAGAGNSSRKQTAFKLKKNKPRQ